MPSQEMMRAFIIYDLVLCNQTSEILSSSPLLLTMRGIGEYYLVNLALLFKDKDYYMVIWKTIMNAQHIMAIDSDIKLIVIMINSLIYDR